MATDFVFPIKIKNDGTRQMQLWIEPWAEEFFVEPSAEVSVEFDGPFPAEIVAIYFEGGIQLYGFNGSSAVVKKAGTVIWTAHQRLPM